jgi:sigma-54 dependent transcriptional regulator, acetoin dehydrogenase operon transcriptional activator AcoR
MHEHARLALESRVAAAREKFFVHNAAPSDLLPRPILRSWDRCRSAGIDERYPLAFEPVGRARLAECRERHEELRRLAEPPAARLAAAVAGARHLVIVTDADGVIVSVFGDRSRVSRTLQLLARPGVDLSERAIGTNSMGTALRERLPVAVTAAEHYCRTNAGFVCMAAPLFLPDGRIAGTIDVTGDYDRSAPPLAAPVLGAARAIEIGLFLATQRDRLLLQFAWDAAELGSKDAGWLAFDDAGRLTGATSAARQLLGLGDGTIHAGFESLFQQRFSAPLRMLDVDAPLRLRTPQGFEFAARLARAGTVLPSALRRQRQLTGTSAPQPCGNARTAAAPEVPQTLRQLTSLHAHEAVEREGGNKLRAARRLGISRSTLYRLLASASDTP